MTPDKPGKRPVIDFNLPGFLALVEKRGPERAALQVVKDLLIMTDKALRFKR